MAFVKALRLLKRASNHDCLEKTYTTLSMSQAWRTKRIIPDVIDDIPTSKLGVQYPNVTINEGNIVHPKQVLNIPEVSWTIQQDDSLYTVCMVCPDAPSKSKPIAREWNHWLVTNIPHNRVTEGETLAEYIGVLPPKDTGLHRYVFLLYAHTKKIKFSEKKLGTKSADGRPNFSIKNFAVKYRIGQPIAGNFFEAEFDETVPLLYKQLSLTPVAH